MEDPPPHPVTVEMDRQATRADLSTPISQGLHMKTEFRISKPTPKAEQERIRMQFEALVRASPSPQSFAQGSEESQVRKRRSSKLPASSLRPVKQIKPNAVLASIGKSDWQSSCTKKEFTPQQDVKIEPTQKEAQPETKSGKAGGDEIQATVKREQESKHFRAVEGNARSSEVAPGMQPVLVAKQEIQQSNMRSPEVSQRIQPSTVPNQETQQKAQIPHLSSVQPAAAVGQVLSTGKVKTEIKEKSCAKAALPEASPIAAERETDFLMRGTSAPESEFSAPVESDASLIMRNVGELMTSLGLESSGSLNHPAQPSQQGDKGACHRAATKSNEQARSNLQSKNENVLAERSDAESPTRLLNTKVDKVKPGDKDTFESVSNKAQAEAMSMMALLDQLIPAPSSAKDLAEKYHLPEKLDAPTSKQTAASTLQDLPKFDAFSLKLESTGVNQAKEAPVSAQVPKNDFDANKHTQKSDSQLAQSHPTCNGVAKKGTSLKFDNNVTEKVQPKTKPSSTEHRTHADVNLKNQSECEKDDKEARTADDCKGLGIGRERNQLPKMSPSNLQEFVNPIGDLKASKSAKVELSPCLRQKEPQQTPDTGKSKAALGLDALAYLNSTPKPEIKKQEENQHRTTKDSLDLYKKLEAASKTALGEKNIGPTHDKQPERIQDTGTPPRKDRKPKTPKKLKVQSSLMKLTSDAPTDHAKKVISNESVKVSNRDAGTVLQETNISKPAKQKSSKGRVLHPPMAYWANERADKAEAVTHNKTAEIPRGKEDRKTVSPASTPNRVVRPTKGLSPKQQPNPIKPLLPYEARKIFDSGPGSGLKLAHYCICPPDDVVAKIRAQLKSSKKLKEKPQASSSQAAATKSDQKPKAIAKPIFISGNKTTSDNATRKQELLAKMAKDVQQAAAEHNKTVDMKSAAVKVSPLPQNSPKPETAKAQLLSEKDRVQKEAAPESKKPSSKVVWQAASKDKAPTQKPNLNEISKAVSKKPDDSKQAEKGSTAATGTKVITSLQVQKISKKPETDPPIKIDTDPLKKADSKPMKAPAEKSSTERAISSKATAAPKKQQKSNEGSKVVDKKDSSANNLQRQKSQSSSASEERLSQGEMIVNGLLIKGDMGVYPRCAECKKARKSYAYCGTHTSVFTCLNRKPLGMEYKDRETGIKSGIIHPGKIYGPGETVPDGSKHGNTKAATNAKEFCAKRKANTQEQAKPVKQHKAENDGEKEPVQKKPKLGVPQNSTGMKAKSDQKPQNPASTKAEATIVKTTEVIDSDIEIVENDGWTMEQAAKLQSVVLGNLDVTAPNYWNLVAKHVKGKTGLQCYNYHMSALGPTPAPKPKTKPRIHKTSVTASQDGLPKKKLTKAGLKKIAREARWEERTFSSDDEDSFQDAKLKQQQTDKYIDGINKRRAEGKQTSRLGQTNAAGLSKPGLASWKNREAINEILPSQKTGHVESDPEEEKDDYFSDASEEL